MGVRAGLLRQSPIHLHQTNGGQLICYNLLHLLFVSLGAFTLHHLLKKRNRFILVLSHPASDTCDWLQVSHPFYTTDLTSGAKIKGASVALMTSSG